MPGSVPARRLGGRPVSKHRQGVKTIYTALRQVIRFFAGFILMILGVVAWRKLWIEERSLMSLEYGELVSLGILLAIALGLIFFASRIKGEIDEV